jgi:hypothetical protein
MNMEITGTTKHTYNGSNRWIKNNYEKWLAYEREYSRKRYYGEKMKSQTEPTYNAEWSKNKYNNDTEFRERLLRNSKKYAEKKRDKKLLEGWIPWLRTSGSTRGMSSDERKLFYRNKYHNDPIYHQKQLDAQKVAYQKKKDDPEYKRRHTERQKKWYEAHRDKHGHKERTKQTTEERNDKRRIRYATDEKYRNTIKNNSKKNNRKAYETYRSKPENVAKLRVYALNYYHSHRDKILQRRKERRKNNKK